MVHEREADCRGAQMAKVVVDRSLVGSKRHEQIAAQRLKRSLHTRRCSALSGVV